MSTDLHVPEVDFKNGKPRGDLAGDAPGHPERLFGPDDRDNDIIVVDDVVGEHNAGDVPGQPAEVTGKEERRPGDPVE